MGNCFEPSSSLSSLYAQASSFIRSKVPDFPIDALKLRPIPFILIQHIFTKQQHAAKKHSILILNLKRLNTINFALPLLCVNPGLVKGGQGVRSTRARDVLKSPAALMLEKLSYVAMYTISCSPETAFSKTIQGTPDF